MQLLEIASVVALSSLGNEFCLTTYIIYRDVKWSVTKKLHFSVVQKVHKRQVHLGSFSDVEKLCVACSNHTTVIMVSLDGFCS